jgi:hypothetical protein
MPKVLVLGAWVLLIGGALFCLFKSTRTVGGDLLLGLLAYLLLVFVLSSECRRRLRSNGILGWLFGWPEPSDELGK